ncbi:MAG: PstA family ABC transporter permease [Pseudonocardiaceae bacterium]
MAGRAVPDGTADPDGPLAEEIRRSTSNRGLSDHIALAGAATAALSLAALMATRVIPSVDVGGFVVIVYLLFVVLYGVLASLEHDRRAITDRLASVAMHSAAVGTLVALSFVVGFTFWRGRQALIHLNFYTHDLQLTGPLDPLSSGGALHAEVGTLIEITIALLIVVPLGLAGAVYLNEATGRLARFVRTVVEAMTALPAILAGLFILASVILIFGLAKSGLAASLAISVMMLPITIRAADVVLRLVPGSLREASLALGAPRWRTAWHVVLPTARSGLTTAVLLATAHGIGETSPVLITAGFGASLNVNPTSGPMVSLPLLTFVLSHSPEPTMVVRAFGAGATLLILVFVLFALARVFGGRGAGELSPRAQRTRARQSQQDLNRFIDRDHARRIGSGYAT